MSNNDNGPDNGKPTNEPNELASGTGPMRETGERRSRRRGAGATPPESGGGAGNGDNGNDNDQGASPGPRDAQPAGTANDPAYVRLTRAEIDPLRRHEFLWDVIRNRTGAVSFNRYRDCIEKILCDPQFDPGVPDVCLTPEAKEDVGGVKGVSVEPPGRRSYSIYGPDSYVILRAATECFLMQECGLLEHAVQQIYQENWADRGEPVLRQLRKDYHSLLEADVEPKVLPYFRTIIKERLGEVEIKKGLSLGAKAKQVGNAPQDSGCYGIIRSRVSSPCFMELIWSYWHEEGMLVQTMNAISLRFQNIRNPALSDPLAHLAIDPLRSLNNLLWGFVQDERNRLSVVRRAYEYEHQYGINLIGKAVPKLSPVDRRSKFIEAFHNLLYRTSAFFAQADDLTVQADGFPILNALKEVHLLLAHGAHNQYGDLPWTSRVEMLMTMWLLGRPEFREFLGGRVMVPYTESWMDRVDTMKALQGWTDTSVTVFNGLATEGERLLLSIRFTNWVEISDGNVAATWALTWRSSIQSYIHSYRTATGIDLTVEPVETWQDSDRALPPAVHLSRRLAAQRGDTPALPPASQAGLSASVREQRTLPSPHRP